MSRSTKECRPRIIIMFAPRCCSIDFNSLEKTPSVNTSVCDCRMSMAIATHCFKEGLRYLLALCESVCGVLRMCVGSGRVAACVCVGEIAACMRVGEMVS